MKKARKTTLEEHESGIGKIANGALSLSTKNDRNYGAVLVNPCRAMRSEIKS